MMAKQGMGMQIGVLILLAVLVWTVVRVAFQASSEVENLEGRKRYAYDLAEGFRLRNTKLPVDSVSFRSCRVEKMRKGPLTFGGFNVLLVEGLELNLPLGRTEDDVSATNETSHVAAQIGLSGTVLRSVGLAGRRFSSVKVDGLTVNRLAGTAVCPVFSATHAESRGKSLRLTDCTVFENLVSNHVGAATLSFRPSRLVWAGGEKDLRELMGE